MEQAQFCCAANGPTKLPCVRGSLDHSGGGVERSYGGRQLAGDERGVTIRESRTQRSGVHAKEQGDSGDARLSQVLLLVGADPPLDVLPHE